MIIGVSSHTGGGDECIVIDPVKEHMDTYLSKRLQHIDYGGGIDDFLIVPYVVFSDEQQNADFAKPSNKVQRTKDYYGDKGWLKTIVFALPFNPDVVSKMSLEEFRVLLCNAILDKLENPDMKILKAFNYEAFKNDVKREVVNYRDNVSII